MRNTFFLLALLFLAAACGKSEATTDDSAAEATTAEAETPPAVTLSDFSESPSFDAKITDYSYTDEQFAFSSPIARL